MIGIVHRILLAGRARVAATAMLHDTASIVNNIGDREAIRIGQFSHVKGELLTFGHGGRICIGDYCFIGEQTYIWSAKNIIIGNRVLISHHCNIFDNDTHPIDPEARHQQFKEIIRGAHPMQIDLNEQEVIIEDDVWIGASSSILRGVRVGASAIVGIGSVVTKDVPPYTIVAGNPARVIRSIPCKGEGR